MDRRAFLKFAAAGALACSAQGMWGPFSAFAKSSPGAADVKFKVADSHFHFMDFIQQTEGVDALIQAMDAAGVEHIFFSGMPLTKKWDAAEPVEPTYYLDDNGRTYWYSGTDFIVARRYNELSEDLKNRFHPFVCGINATDKHAVLHVERMFNEYPDVWQGVGEVFCHRDDLTNLTYGETARANHPAMDAVYDLAGSKGMPVTIHNNATSRRKQDKPIYVYEVKDALKRHPRTNIIWAHAGLSRLFTLDQVQYTAMLRDMLKTHKNLYIDLSWLVFETYVMENEMRGIVRPEWLALVKEFPDRFMIGSDAIGHYETYHYNIVKYYPLLEALGPKKAQMAAMDNFLGLLPSKGAANKTKKAA
ncbi:MAG: amidohydrolase family protein [Desulfovibrionaceae bacterium]